MNPDQVITITNGLSDLSKRIQEAHADEETMKKKRIQAWKSSVSVYRYKKKH